MSMAYRVNFESDDNSVAIHVTVDERIEDEYVDGDQFLRDVLAGFEDTFGKSWDESVELGASINGMTSPTVVFSMPGGLGDLVNIIGLHGNYDSVFRGFMEEAVEKAHAEAIERRREVIRAGERPKIVRLMCEVAIDTLIESIDEDEVFGRLGVDHITDEKRTPLMQEIASGVLAEFMANPVGFLIGQLRAPMPESAATPAALSTVKMPDDWQTSKALDAIDVPGVDAAEPEPNGPTDPEGPKSTDPDPIPWDAVDVEQPEPEPEPEFNEADFRTFFESRAGNTRDFMALVEARGTVTLTDAAEALGVETKALGGITGGITRASNSRNVVVPIDTNEDESGERFWTWTGPEMGLGWTEPEPQSVQVEHEIVEDGGHDRQTDITDFIEPGATANDPEFPIGGAVDEDPFAIDEDDVAAVEEHISEVVEAEIVTGGIDEAEPEPNGPNDPDGDADAVLSHEKIIALDLDSDEKKVLRFIASAGPITQEQIEDSVGGLWRDITKGIYKKWGVKHGRGAMLIHFDFEASTYSINIDALG